MINSVSPLTVNVHTIYHLQLKHYCIYNSVFEIILKLYISMKIIIFISFLLIIHFVFHSYFKYSNILNLASSFNNLSPIFCASKTDIFLSSPIVHSLMYCLSSFTTSSKSVILLRPLTCHIPVSPGLVARRAR